MRTIAIILNDNDFGNTFRPLLESLYRAVEWNGELSEDVVKAAVMAGLEFHYVAFQHGKNFGQRGYGTVTDTVKYLSDARVLFDEAAEADICQVPHDGGAWYLELDSGNVSAY